MYTQDDKVSISDLIKDQFPDFYKEQGPQFIAFVKAYYEWLEQDRNILFDTRKLLDYRDIDNTLDEFLIHFREKFMSGLDDNIIGNQRLFQKHILDLYRSKGSLAGIQLFFRLLFNEEVNVYVPSQDILIASDGVWVVPQYIEVDYIENIWDFEGQIVRGTRTGATALVERIETKTVNNRPVYLFYVYNVKGAFATSEILVYADLGIEFGVKIKGSPIQLNAITSSPLFEAGDVIYDVGTPSNPKPLMAVVTETYDSVGIIDFLIVDGGSYYSTDANISITAGSNTSGTGADFRIGSIGNTTEFLYNTDKLMDYRTVRLDAEDYGFFGGIQVFNAESRMMDALTIDEIEVGSIERLVILNPGTGYDGSVTVTITDPYTTTRGMFIEDRPMMGKDAVISGESITGTGLALKLDVIDSSFGYNTDGQVLSLELIDGARTVSASVVTGGIGHLEGYYDDTKGFLSSNKYLFDGHFYQNFSYVIKSSHQLNDYAEIYRKIMHVAGNRIYGRLVLNNNTNVELHANHSGIVQVAL